MTRPQGATTRQTEATRSAPKEHETEKTEILKLAEETGSAEQQGDDADDIYD